MRNQKGVVALITTIIIGILLVIIATSMTTLMIFEQRQATDADQSNRAFYAAQAGVEDGVLKIRDALTTGNPTLGSLQRASCPASGDDNQKDLLASDDKNTNPPSVLGYTCQLITFNKNQLSGTAQLDESIQVDLSGLNFSRLQLNWGHDTSSNLNSPDDSFTAASAWTYPAVVEINVIAYPTAAQFSYTNVTTTTFLLKPQLGGGSGFDITTQATSSPVKILCQSFSAANPYNCRASITGFNTGANNYIVRMRPRYKTTLYQAQFLDSVGNVVNIPDQYATIDVTARAGSTFRRIQAKMPIRSGVPSGLDYVLYSDTNICKDFLAASGGAFTNSSC